MSMYRPGRQVLPSTAVRTQSRHPTSQKCCFLCSQIGHFAKNCPDANKNNDNSKNDTKAHQSTEFAPQNKANNTGGAGKSKSERTVSNVTTLDNEVTFPQSALHQQFYFVSWNSIHQLIKLASRPPLCVGVGK